MLDERSIEERIEIMRHDIVALLRADPHCPLANMLGRELMDLYLEL